MRDFHPQRFFSHFLWGLFQKCQCGIFERVNTTKATMPAYNFKSQFAPAIEAGTKLCTIRGRAAKVGATAYLYTGMRTKACRKLGQGTITRCEPIIIGRDVDAFPVVVIDDQKLRMTEVWDLAEQDGFVDAEKFVDFFADSQAYKPMLDGGFQVFTGFMITWELDK